MTPSLSSPALHIFWKLLIHFLKDHLHFLMFHHRMLHHLMLLHLMLHHVKLQNHLLHFHQHQLKYQLNNAWLTNRIIQFLLLILFCLHLILLNHILNLLKQPIKYIQFLLILINIYQLFHRGLSINFQNARI